MSTASGPENMASGSQEPLPEVGDIATNTLLAPSNLELMATQPVTSKGKKHQRASSGTARSKSLIFIELSH